MSLVGAREAGTGWVEIQGTGDDLRMVRMELRSFGDTWLVSASTSLGYEVQNRRQKYDVEGGSCRLNSMVRLELGAIVQRDAGARSDMSSCVLWKRSFSYRVHGRSMKRVSAKMACRWLLVL